jgi:dihydroflavonol-4-reductase
LKKAVVTGATGMLGAHLACELHHAGYSVKCTFHVTSTDLFEKIARTYKLSHTDFEWVAADVLDSSSLLEAFKGADSVFHCAAVVKYRKQDEEQLYATNVLGTRNCCNACLQLRIPELIYASSIAALGRSPGTRIINENSAWVDSPLNTIYSETKYLAELEVWRAAEEGLNVAVLNPGVIIGAGDGKTGSNAIFKHVSKRSWFFPAGRTGFVGVQDVTNAMISASINKVYNTRLLLVSENLFYKEVLQLVSREMGVKPPHWALKGFVLKLAVFVAAFCEKLHIPFPFPSQGLVATAADVEYQTKNIHLLPGFKFTSVNTAIKQAVSTLRQG